jgi:hypothetical protein
MQPLDFYCDLGKGLKVIFIEKSTTYKKFEDRVYRGSEK